MKAINRISEVEKAVRIDSITVKQHSLCDNDPSLARNPEIIAYVLNTAKEHKIDQHLAYTLADFESGFNPYACNPKSSAKGIFQFINSTWNNYCLGNVFDYKDNINCGVRLLSEDGGISHWLADPAVKKHLIEKGAYKEYYVQK